MTHRQLTMLSRALQQDRTNIALAARHLVDLLRHDALGATRPKLSDDDIRIVGARYNRGIAPTLEQIRRNTSYGDLILRLWSRFTGLLR